MHIGRKAEFPPPPSRGLGWLARIVTALLAWQTRDTERRLLLSLNERLREDSGVGLEARYGGKR